ncbi:hypothetical protein [Phreatobacter sp.]|uniref:hypothetical protein n=1 Tax=Phreatobacter sp. TaxID=1966341 RepID=UPI0022C1DAB1|nr:hypothetical protein [Phreatobacter sp.]MCZ8315447.1 hypothetical protein [Phreatobacter sp.]
MRALLLAAFAALFLSVAGEANAQARQDFAIVNQTGYTIDEVYVSPTSANNWGDDLMGDNSLENGMTLNVSFPVDTTACRYDIKVVYDDETPVEFRNVNLCRIARVTLFYNRGSGETRAVVE